MGAALETLTSYVTKTSTTAGTFYPLAAQSGQSLTVRATPTDQAGVMLDPFAEFPVAGYVQIKSPRMHDQQVGTTFVVQPDTNTTALETLTALDYDEPIWNTDTLQANITTIASNTASGTYVAGWQMYYPSLGGILANFASWAQVQSYVQSNVGAGRHYCTWVTPSSAGTAGQIGAAVAINSVNDQYKAGGSYALLGYLVSAQVGAILLQGTDTGNLYVGGPGSLDAKSTRNYFVDLSIQQGISCIPIVQANNRATTYVYVVDGATTSTAVSVGLVWLYLGQNVPVPG
jgi:hypothetical protein